MSSTISSAPPLPKKFAANAGNADIVIANNVLAHVENLHDFVAGIRALVGADGVAVIDVHYWKALLEGLQFDTIYHEHLCYFSLQSLAALLEQHELYILAVEVVQSQGGSLRVTAGPQAAECVPLQRMIADERDAGLAGIARHEAFSDRVRQLKTAIVELVTRVRSSGGTVAGYGAAAKGSMLLNTCGIGTNLIDYVVDINPHKHGWLMPGVHIPILPVHVLRERRPDFLLLLPWNLQDEIFAQESWYRDQGGRFIMPLPEPKVV